MKRLLFLPLVFLFAACEVDFTPNAEWKNIPVIYCLLDQDDDTTWVRVQRCYLTEDNIYNYGQNSDSINYPQGSITVSLLAYENGTQKDSMAFNYTERNRDSGHFANTAQPLYWFVTRNRLKENYTYVLTVRNSADNSILATTEPISLIKQTASTLITKPTVTVLNGTDTVGGGFAFFDNTGTSSTTLYCHIKWNSLENARLYQPIVRLYYEAQDSVRYVDLHAPKVSSKYSETYYSRDVFLDELKNLLEGDTCRKRYIPTVDMYLTACSEELNAYMTTATPGSSLSQHAETFNNIRGGVGVFASRRTHLFKRMPSDETVGDRGLLHFLTELGVGFY